MVFGDQDRRYSLITSLGKRLDALEASHEAKLDKLCPSEACGGALPPEDNRYVPVYTNHTDGVQDEWCSYCGRPLRICLKWEP
jgi:hypothetical protein